MRMILQKLKMWQQKGRETRTTTQFHMHHTAPYRTQSNRRKTKQHQVNTVEEH